MAMAKGAVLTQDHPREGWGTRPNTLVRKTIRYGTSDRAALVATIELIERKPGEVELSICGSVIRGGHDVAGGQNRDDFRDLLENGKLERPRAELQKLLQVWDRWHLNGLRAGCEHQRAAQWSKMVIPKDCLGPEGRYASGPDKDHVWATQVRADQHPDGLLTAPCPVCGYRYGSAWLHEPLPQEVIDWVYALK